MSFPVTVSAFAKEELKEKKKWLKVDVIWERGWKVGGWAKIKAEENIKMDSLGR
jgi:hypothetical protein